MSEPLANKIPWTDCTWNVTTGCTKVSTGCKHCYAERMTKRQVAMGTPKYAAGFDEVVCHPDELEKPLRWKKPRRIFVNSMSDLFHRDVPSGFILDVFSVMERASQHTFQVLTKRPERMVDVLGGTSGAGLSAPALPNIWLGTSGENQAAVNGRTTHLLRCPAAVRFLSLEPLLGEVNLTRVAHTLRDSPAVVCGTVLGSDGRMFSPGGAAGTGVDWVIVGGESGPGARPMHPDWVRSIRDQCAAAGVPFFFKGFGKKKAGDLLDGKRHQEWPEVTNA